jgi:predicted transcriptional regulator
MPEQAMLCTLWVWAVIADGSIVASNFIQFSVQGSFLEQDESRRVLRVAPHDWASEEWSGKCSERDSARDHAACYGEGHGFFEWTLPVPASELARATRLRVLCEASARRDDTPQTDCAQHPTTLRISLNGIRVYQANLPNHPHDARGALSYLRGQRGAYGYLAHATVEGALLQEVLAYSEDTHVRLRCAVPSDGQHQGGLTIYGADSGRFPVSPTLVLEF